MKNISQKIVRLLTKKKLNISFAESCTGGLLSSTITSINGSSKVFTIGFVTYSNQSKINSLKVPKDINLVMIDVETGLPPDKNTKSVIYESFKSKDIFFTNLEKMSNKDRLGINDSKKQKTVLKFY